MLVYCTGQSVHGFTLDQTLGEFILSHSNIATPEDGGIYSINQGTYNGYEQSVKNYIEVCQEKQLSARYIGSLVGDFHRNLLKGGIYIYPATKKDPNGKLRLMYECYPLAFIAEKSGGRASNGSIDILDIEPVSFHQRSPIYIGASKMVEQAITSWA